MYNNTSLYLIESDLFEADIHKADIITFCVQIHPLIV